MSEESGGQAQVGAAIIAAFVSLSSHLIMHQIDVTSAHFAVAFKIPIHNISIYFSKLFSFRCLLIAVGSLSEYVMYQISNIFHKADQKEHPRKYVSLTCLGMVLILRSIFLSLLHVSSHLSYHVYIILSIEAFFFGCFHNSVLAIAPEHSVPVVLSANASRLFVLMIQFLLDRCYYQSPLLMIKIQCWICFIFTAIAFGLWCYYHIGAKYSSNSGSKDGGFSGKDFFKTFGEAFSPFIMFGAGSMFKDFLFPGVLPYALLERDKCHVINMVIPIFCMLGPISLFVMEQTKTFDKWKEEFNAFWILIIPMAVIFVYSFLAIHTRIPSARAIANSRWRVLITTLIVVVCNSYLDPVSFSGVARVVKPQGGGGDNGGNGGDINLLTCHNIMALFLRFVFSKLSVGYNDTRVSLGYHLPRFRPRHRMSNWNTFWYILRKTFSRGFTDTVSDFRMNIQKYL